MTAIRYRPAFRSQVLLGTYTNDFPTITRPVTIEVDPCCAGQAVVLNATIDLPNQKGIILALASLTVNGLTFQGAHISNALGGNGAGIRDQNTFPSAKLIIQNSLFTGNQEGILTGDNPDQVVMVSNSSFVNNGNPDPSFFQHALYVNCGTMLSVSNTLFCGQLIGHSVKSRAAATMVSGNQIHDGAQGPSQCEPGSSSLAIDAANGGAATITSNTLVQGPEFTKLEDRRLWRRRSRLRQQQPRRSHYASGTKPYGAAQFAGSSCVVIPVKLLLLSCAGTQFGS